MSETYVYSTDDDPLYLIFGEMWHGFPGGGPSYIMHGDFVYSYPPSGDPLFRIEHGSRDQRRRPANRGRSSGI